MADNVAITAGSGTTVAADEVTDATLGTAKVQYMKIMDGTLDGTAKAAVNSVGLKVDASGAYAPHNVGTVVSKTVQLTSATTSTIWDPAAGKRLAITSVQIQAGGTTGGAVQVYFGTGAYSRGTNYALFDGEFLPSSTAKPGVVLTPAVPYCSVTADTDLLRVTSAAAINPLTVTVWGYEF